MGESLLRRDYLLRLMGPDGDGQGGPTGLAATIQDFQEVLETVPIASPSVSTTRACAARTPHAHGASAALVPPPCPRVFPKGTVGRGARGFVRRVEIP